jgi:methyl-accepting chemotaxis protein
MLAKFPIRTKIIAVVAFLMVAMTGMGLLAVKNMRSINANTVDISTSWLPSVRILGDLRAGVITYRNVIREHMLAETLEEKLAQEKTLVTVVESNTKIRAAYEPLITSAEERAMYNEWVSLWESYKKGTEEVMALSRKAAGKIPTEAHELNTKTVNKIGLDADAVLRKDIDLNNTGADKAAQDAADSYAAAFMMLAVILGAAVVAGIGVSYYLVRDVSTGIASIVTPMQALGNGDLSADVPHQGEKTEIGAMADTLQVFKRALIAKKAADEAAAADAEAKIERGRRVDNITRNFETVIGEIVQTVSSASTQLEASAGTLSATAERAQTLTTTVAGSLRQCAVGGVGDRRAFLLCHRDQPPGAGIGADGNRCGRSGPRHQQPGQRIVQGGEPHRRRRRAHQHHRGAD